MDDKPFSQILEKGISATIHSEDSSYFGGYMNENYSETAKACCLNTDTHTKKNGLQKWEIIFSR